jgi:hypothetical protein
MSPPCRRTLKPEGTLSDLADQACGLTPAELELNPLQAALLISSWLGNPNGAIEASVRSHY